MPSITALASCLYILLLPLLPYSYVPQLFLLLLILPMVFITALASCLYLLFLPPYPTSISIQFRMTVSTTVALTSAPATPLALTCNSLLLHQHPTPDFCFYLLLLPSGRTGT